MRALIEIVVDKTQSLLLPFDHQYALASYIYKTIGKTDPEYFIWLHNKRNFKFFTFSYLMAKKRKVRENGMEIKSDKLYFFVSSPMVKFMKALISGMLSNPEVNICGIKGVVESIRILEKPELKSRIKLKTLSPIIVRKPLKENGKLKAVELYPTDEEFSERLISNLKKKFEEFCLMERKKTKPEGEISIEFVRFKPKRHRIMNTYHRCILGEFVVEGDEKLIEFGYEAGFGEKNSMGFGMVRVV